MSFKHPSVILFDQFHKNKCKKSNTQKAVLSIQKDRQIISTDFVIIG